MRIVYCCNTILASGGTERVLVNRANYLVEKFNYDVYIVTSDEKNDKEAFFKLNPKIKVISLEINHFEGVSKNFFVRRYQLKKKSERYLIELTKIVNEIKPDVLVSMGDYSRGVVWKVNYSCKKYVENHFSKKYIIEGREIEKEETLKKRLKNFYREYNAKKLIEKYDAFLVLTEEDKKNWGGNNKIKVINNPLTFYPIESSTLNQKCIISLGRLHEGKGYDMLIDIWKKVNRIYSDWTLEIYGEGNERKKLQTKIDEKGLTNVFKLMGKTNNVYEKLLNSSLYVMTSRYEGFGMVLIEAMSCGLPVISFDCSCGPKEIIKNNENGYICKLGDIDDMANKIIYLIKNSELRKKFGKESKELAKNYLEDKIMFQWKELYEN